MNTSFRYEKNGFAISRIRLKKSSATLDLYTAPFDWSEKRPSEREGFCFIRNNVPVTYGDNTELANTNGILNGNSLWGKAENRGQTVLITGAQRDAPEMLHRMIQFYGEEQFRCDVLKYLHHGQKNYSPYTLNATSPKIGDVYYLSDGNLILTLNETEITASGDASASK